MKKSKQSSKCLLSAFILLLMLTNPFFAVSSHAEEILVLDNMENKYNLNGIWKIAFADDPSFSKPETDDSKWQTISLPGVSYRLNPDYKKGVAWYRRAFLISKNCTGRDLGIIIPWIGDAHELYVNGHFIGGRGTINAAGIPFKMDMLFLERRTDPSYIYFGLFSIFGGYMYATISTLGFWIIDSFWLNWLATHFCYSLFSLTLVQFVRHNFNFKLPWLLYVAIANAIFMMVFSIGVYISHPVLIAFIIYGQYIEMLIYLSISASCLVLIFISILRREPGSGFIGIGLAVVFAAMCNDTLSNTASLKLPELLDFGALAFIMSIAISLSVKYNRIFLETLRLNEYLEKTNASFSRFVPREFLRFLNREEIVNVELGDNVQCEMTILFSDIRSFTSISEKMSPQETFTFLNGLLERLCPLIRKHGGFIDKYLGDGIMALFPGSPDVALDAAIEMHRGLANLLQEKRKGREKIHKIRRT